MNNCLGAISSATSALPDATAAVPSATAAMPDATAAVSAAAAVPVATLLLAAGESSQLFHSASNSCSSSRRLPHTPTMKPLFRSSNAISRPKPEVATITIALRQRLSFGLSIVLATNYLTSVRRPVSEFMMKPLTVMSLGIRG